MDFFNHCAQDYHSKISTSVVGRHSWWTLTSHWGPSWLSSETTNWFAHARSSPVPHENSQLSFITISLRSLQCHSLTLIYSRDSTGCRWSGVFVGCRGRKHIDGLLGEWRGWLRIVEQQWFVEWSLRQWKEECQSFFRQGCQTFADSSFLTVRRREGRDFYHVCFTVWLYHKIDILVETVTGRQHQHSSDVST